MTTASPMKKGRCDFARPFPNSINLSATSRGIRQEHAISINQQIDGMRNVARSESLFKAVVPLFTEKYGHDHPITRD